MKENEYNTKGGHKSLNDWIEIVKRIEGVKYVNFSGIKISDDSIRKQIRYASSDFIRDADIQLLIRILCRVDFLPNAINASYDGKYLVLHYKYDSKNEGLFLINSEGCKYKHIIDCEQTIFKKANESGIVSAINKTIEDWADKF